MARIVKSPDIRKQELIDIALKQFMQSGYDKTSVRGILQVAGGEIGMFYHYFKSKDEIFKAALERYNELFLMNSERLLKDTHIPLTDRLRAILTGLSTANAEYARASSSSVHPEMKLLLLSATLNRMVPLVESILKKALETGLVKKLPTEDIHALSLFTLYGISAVIHDPVESKMDFKLKQIQVLLKNILGLEVIL